MSSAKIAVIDYGMGNLWSVLNALTYLGYDATTSNDPDIVVNAEKMILPGVGSFRRAMESLRKTGLQEAIEEAVTKRGRKILGICLGMQLMGISSSEDGETEGIGLINSKVEKFYTVGIKIPHVGFNEVDIRFPSILFDNLPDKSDFYFVHSYRMLPDQMMGCVSTCKHGEVFAAAYENENIFATQFHPEKSQANGLIVLNNFLKK